MIEGNRPSLPVKFAEAFGFGRAKKIFFWSTGTSNLVLSSPDGESGRPVGKVECLGVPKGKLVGAAFFWLLFFRCCKKSNSPARRNKMLINAIQLMFAMKVASSKLQILSVLCGICGKDFFLLAYQVW